MPGKLIFTKASGIKNIFRINFIDILVFGVSFADFVMSKEFLV
jgi:hypothetical protein